MPPRGRAISITAVKTTRSAGRPDERSRSTRTREAILSATVDLLDEVGFAAMTIEAIAAKAGAGKATIYRWWPDKASVAMDAVLAQIDPAAPYPDTGSVVEDFRLHAGLTAQLFSRPRMRQMLTGIILEADRNAALHDAFRTRYMEPRRAQGRVRLRAGVERGELPADLDFEPLFDAIYGAIYFRLLISFDPLDTAFTDTIVRQTFHGVLLPPARS